MVEKYKTIILKIILNLLMVCVPEQINREFSDNGWISDNMTKPLSTCCYLKPKTKIKNSI